ncbi:MAG: tetratricopeptide repeat protein [Candidatus Helarchaeota archaeon]
MKNSPVDKSQEPPDGYSLAILGQFQNALSEFNEELKNDPNNPILLYNIGIAHQQLGHYYEALKFFNKSINLKPNPLTFVHKGITLGILGQFQNALIAFNNALKIDNTCTDAWFNIAVLFDKTGHPEKAADALNIVLSIDPNDFITKEELKKLMKKINKLK